MSNKPVKSYVKITHRMNEYDKKLFRTLYEYALPELFNKKHVISEKELIKQWELGEGLLHFAFLNRLNVVITDFRDELDLSILAVFDVRGKDNKGNYYYAFSPELKKMLEMPRIVEALTKEGLLKSMEA